VNGAQFDPQRLGSKQPAYVIVQLQPVGKRGATKNFLGRARKATLRRSWPVSHGGCETFLK
jgi:hypothetical protein